MCFSLGSITRQTVLISVFQTMGHLECPLMSIVLHPIHYHWKTNTLSSGCWIWGIDQVVEDYFMNSELQGFAQATHIRLELLAWNTDVLADQHFAVNEVIVYGQACVCNGHATMCDGATCICEQNTTGVHCEDCLEGYFEYSPEVCTLCQCNTAGTIGGSNMCNRVTGQCPCKPNIVGVDCSLCAPGYYKDGGNASCLPCDDQCLECTGPGLTDCVVRSSMLSLLGFADLDNVNTFPFYINFKVIVE